MKYSYLILVAVALVAASHGNPIANTFTNMIQGSQTAANLMMVSTARAIAPLVDGFLALTQRFLNMGKHYMAHLDQMLGHMDMDPQMQIMAEAMHQNLYDMEAAVDGLMSNAKWGGAVIKSTADCVVPQVELIAQIKDEAFRELGKLVSSQRESLHKMADAGNQIQGQVDELQALESKVTEMIQSGKGLEAMDYIISNRQKTEKQGREMEKVYFGALDEFREATAVNIKKLSDVLGVVYEHGDKIMAKLDNCVEPKIKQMIRTEIKNKKNHKTPNTHLLPEHLSFRTPQFNFDSFPGFYDMRPMPRPFAPAASATKAPSTTPTKASSTTPKEPTTTQTATTAATPAAPATATPIPTEGASA